jgi:hypothetical protein
MLFLTPISQHLHIPRLVSKSSVLCRTLYPPRLWTTSNSFTQLSSKIFSNTEVYCLLLTRQSFPVAPLGAPSVMSLGSKPSAAIQARNTAADACGSLFNVSCAMELYSIPYTAVPSENNRLVVPGFISQYANEQNLAVSQCARRGMVF